MTMMRTGLRNLGIIPLRYMVSGALEGALAPWDFDPALAVPVMSMGKRGLPTPTFATGPIFQGRFDNTGVPDVVSYVRGAQVHGDFYANFDGNQVGIAGWYIPEIANADRAAGYSTIYYIDVNNYLWYDWTNSRFEVAIDGSTITAAQALTAGTRYHFLVRWQVTGPIDGTNYACLTIRNVDTFGITSAPSVTPTATLYLGNVSGTLYSADGVIEGFDVRRVPWFDSIYGVSMIYTPTGPLDEMDAIYAAAAGADPALINGGSWDFPLFVPTNATAGALVTGTGEAWSHPHSSNVLSHGWAEDGFYGGGDWAVVFNGTTTTVNCGSGITLDDIGSGAVFTVDGWFRHAGGTTQIVIGKGYPGTAGWLVWIPVAGTTLQLRVDLATDVQATYDITALSGDNKWHYYRAYYNDATKTGRISVDGVWGAANVGAGAWVSDAALNLRIGSRYDGAIYPWSGALGWQRLSNNDRGGGAAGTDFIAPRILPGVDGNTIEQWTFNEGTGAGPNTLIAQVTTPANDGDLQNGTWEPQWNQNGSPVEFHGVEYNATTTSGVITDAARIQDLHAADMTIDLYVRLYSRGEGNQGRLLDKTAVNTKGWQSLITVNGFGVQAIYAGGNATSYTGTDEYTWDGKLHLLSAQLDFASRTWYQWIDGIPVTSYQVQAVGAGAAVTDVGENLYVGNDSAGARTTDGMLGGWLRVSSTGRYTVGEAFIPEDPFTAPGADANSAWQTSYADGAGATLTDTSAGANNATLANYTWLNSFDMNDISPGSRIYGGQGYIVGSDGANDGTIQTHTGLTPGDDYVIRVVGHPGPDSRGDLNIYVYDEIGAAAITDFDLCQFTGIHTGANNSATLIAPAGTFSQRQVGAGVWNITDGSLSVITAVSGDGTTVTANLAGGTDNDWDTGDVFRITWAQTGSVGNVVDRYPNNEIFSFELPAGCTSISIRLRETSGEGGWWVQQVELYEQLVDNPSMEGVYAGVPPIPPGWGQLNLDPGDSQASSTGGGVIHSGSDALQYNAGAGNNERIRLAVPQAQDTYACFGAWFYSGAALSTSGTQWHGQASDAAIILTAAGATWQHIGAVVRRAAGANAFYNIEGRGAGTRYADDAYAFVPDPVSLTCTPANLANSTEATGLRVDGYDNAPQPIPAGTIFAQEGWIRVGITHRHDIGDMRAFGELTPYFFIAWGNAANFILVQISAANTVTLTFNDGGGVHTANWAAAGAMTAANLDTLEVQWDAAHMELRVDTVLRINIAQPPNFAVVPTAFYPGTDQTGTQQVDAVLGPPA